MFRFTAWIAQMTMGVKIRHVQQVMHNPGRLKCKLLCVLNGVLTHSLLIQRKESIHCLTWLGHLLYKASDDDACNVLCNTPWRLNNT